MKDKEYRMHELAKFERADWADRHEAICYKAICSCGWRSAFCPDYTALTLLWLEHSSIANATKEQK